LRTNLSTVRTFILDEADRLLDQGFRPEIEKIVSSLPNRAIVSRQTLLFSATVSKEIREISSLTLLPNHIFISTVKEEDNDTHQHVTQTYLQVPIDDTYPVLLEAIRRQRQIDDDACKIMVFLSTAAGAEITYQLFATLKLDSLPTWVIHSRLSQSKRSKVAEDFKKATKGILFSSDVTARGMDFPNVSCVIQVGKPDSSDQYIHRLGRTARAGQSGRGLIILTDYESRAFFRDRTIAGIKIGTEPGPDSFKLGATRLEIDAAARALDDSFKTKAYKAWLGHEKGCLKAFGWNETELVQRAAHYAKVLKFVGRPEDQGLPPLLAKTVGKMGLKSSKNLLNVVQFLPNSEDD